MDPICTHPRLPHSHYGTERSRSNLPTYPPFLCGVTKKAISYLENGYTFHPATVVKDKAASLKTFASSPLLPQATDDGDDHREGPVALSVSSVSPQEDPALTERRRAAASHLYVDEQYVVNLFQVCGAFRGRMRLVFVLG